MSMVKLYTPDISRLEFSFHGKTCIRQTNASSIDPTNGHELTMGEGRGGEHRVKDG